MINKKECINLFNKYALNYNLKDKMMMLKFHHTHRVVNYAEMISASLNLSEEDKEIVFLGALLHDVGRFEQYKIFNTYDDHNSIDHGDFGYYLLIKDNFIDEFTNDNYVKKIVLYSVKNHNKLNIKNLNDKDYLVASIIRDADKLDIITEQNNEINDNKLQLKKPILDSLNNQKMCSNEFVKNDIDYILRSLGFIFDLNYKYSLKVIKEKNIVINKLNLIETYINGDDQFIKLKNSILDYIEKRA